MQALADDFGDPATGSLGGWYAFDEPDNGIYRLEDSPLSFATILDGLWKIRDLADNSGGRFPILIPLNTGVDPDYGSPNGSLTPLIDEELWGIVEVADILVYDIFNLYRAHGFRGSDLNAFVPGLERLLAMARDAPGPKVVLFAPPSIGYQVGSPPDPEDPANNDYPCNQSVGENNWRMWRRHPLLEEARFMAWAGVLHGASGILWVDYFDNECQPTVDGEDGEDFLYEISRELAYFRAALVDGAGEEIVVEGGYRDPDLVPPSVTLREAAFSSDPDRNVLVGAPDGIGPVPIGGSAEFLIEYPEDVPPKASLILRIEKDATTVGGVVGLRNSGNEVRPLVGEEFRLHSGEPDFSFALPSIPWTGDSDYEVEIPREDFPPWFLPGVEYPGVLYALAMPGERDDRTLRGDARRVRHERYIDPDNPDDGHNVGVLTRLVSLSEDDHYVIAVNSSALLLEDVGLRGLPGTHARPWSGVDGGGEPKPDIPLVDGRLLSDFEPYEVQIWKILVDP